MIEWLLTTEAPLQQGSFYSLSLFSLTQTGSSGAKAQPKTVPKSFIMVTESVSVEGCLMGFLMD